MKLLYILILTLAFHTCFAQENVKNIEVPRYDSLVNFLGDKAMAYTGQTLYLNKKPKFLRDEGYEGFINDYLKDKYTRANIYQCCGTSFSNYDALAGRYFKVIKVIPHPMAAARPYRYGCMYYLELLDIERNAVVYYEYNAKKEMQFPFITMGFWAKAKQINIGRNMVVKNTVLKDKLDRNTDELIYAQPGIVWKCRGVVIDENYKLSLLVTNSKNQKCTVDYLAMLNKDDGVKIFTPQEALANKEKFGSEYWNSVLQNQVKGGMTKEMIKLSWGKPERIHTVASNKSVTTEQWVYEDYYLYFDNGKLARLQ